MRTRSNLDQERTHQITLSVLQRIHQALANIEFQRCTGLHIGWISMADMQNEYANLQQMRDMVCNGENLATTKHLRLCVLRELVIAGAVHSIPDSEYFLTNKRAWFRIGPVSIRLRESVDQLKVVCSMFPLNRDDGVELATCEVPYELARAKREVHR